MLTFSGHCRALALGVAATILLSLSALAEPLGSNLPQLLDAMEQSHPALNAAAASRDAAAAEVEIAGALPDPQFEASCEDIDREHNGPPPESLGSIFYKVGQADLADAIGAVRRLKHAEIEHMDMLYEQHTLLAELERLMGGSL